MSIAEKVISHRAIIIHQLTVMNGQVQGNYTDNYTRRRSSVYIVFVMVTWHGFNQIRNFRQNQTSSLQFISISLRFTFKQFTRSASFLLLLLLPTTQLIDGLFLLICNFDSWGNCINGLLLPPSPVAKCRLFLVGSIRQVHLGDHHQSVSAVKPTKPLVQTTQLLHTRTSTTRGTEVHQFRRPGLYTSADTYHSCAVGEQPSRG